MLNLHYREYGEGKPLVILHGLFGSSDNWQSLALRFAAFYHVYCLDLRNHGRSPWGESQSYDDMTDDVYAFIEENQLKDILLIGHSMGGKVAMHFAQNYPHLVQKLVVVDMGIKSYPMHHQHILAGIHALHLGSINTRKQAEDILKIYVENDGIRQFLLKNLYWKEKGRLAWRMNVPVLEHEMPKILAALPKKVSWIPTLFLSGELSNYILSDDIQEIEEIFPDATFEILPNAGHWLHSEQPDLFFDAVMSFCLR